MERTMFNFFKMLKERKARHIAEVYRTQIYPEEYLRREREIRKNNIVEAVSAVVLCALIAFLVKLWFVVEGFSIKW